MAEHDPDRTTPGHPARIRALLRRATNQEGAARVWSLAVACQLIDEHLAALRRRPAGLPAQVRRQAACCRAWTARLDRVQAALSQHRVPPPQPRAPRDRAQAPRRSGPGVRPTPA